MKRTLFAVLAVFVTWSVLGFIIHGLFLGSIYAATPQLWRPMQEMKTGLMYFASLITAASFVIIYSWFVVEKSIKSALLYGIIFGVGTGISMGYGSYSVMPIPYIVAFVWFIGCIVEYALGGLVVGLIIKKDNGRFLHNRN
jgi:putative Mn2+ efflux pump MntP